MSTNSNLTIGDVLPSSMKSNYSSELLGTSMNTAMDVVKFDMAPPSDLTDKDVEDMNSIYQMYEGSHATNTDSSYWNTSTSDNEAYWSKS
jgi:hypothetical protein